MTARTIASTTFDAWAGELRPPLPAVSTFVRTGVAGLGAVVGAAQPQRCEVTAHIVDTLVNVGTARSTAEAWQGTFVDATDDLDRNFNHTLVESVVCAINPCLGDDEAVLTVTMVLWPDEVPT